MTCGVAIDIENVVVQDDDDDDEIGQVWCEMTQKSCNMTIVKSPVVE